jgi:GNAT superfamily N-acetyltransferase
MSDLFRDVSPEDTDLQPVIDGLFGEYAARYGDYFSKDAEIELTEWYLAPQGLFIVLERDGVIIATGAYKPYDPETAEIKRIWTDKTLRQQGLAARVVQELERRAVLAGYSQMYLTTGFRQPEAVRSWFVTSSSCYAMAKKWRLSLAIKPPMISTSRKISPLRSSVRCLISMRSTCVAS